MSGLPRLIRPISLARTIESHRYGRSRALAPEKMKSRGFNQVESLFKTWADDHYRWADILQRLRPTDAQWHLPRSQRSENVHRAFGLRETADVKNKHILLVEQRCLRLIQNF